MDKDDQKDVAMFGFKRSRNRKAARIIVFVSLAVVAFGVWFVIFRH
jgi:hypothetical protein